MIGMGGNLGWWRQVLRLRGAVAEADAVRPQRQGFGVWSARIALWAALSVLAVALPIVCATLIPGYWGNLAAVVAIVAEILCLVAWFGRPEEDVQSSECRVQSEEGEEGSHELHEEHEGEEEGTGFRRGSGQARGLAGLVGLSAWLLVCVAAVAAPVAVYVLSVPDRRIYGLLVTTAGELLGLIAWCGRKEKEVQSSEFGVQSDDPEACRKRTGFEICPLDELPDCPICGLPMTQIMESDGVEHIALTPVFCLACTPNIADQPVKSICGDLDESDKHPAADRGNWTAGGARVRCSVCRGEIPTDGRRHGIDDGQGQYLTVCGDCGDRHHWDFGSIRMAAQMTALRGHGWEGQAGEAAYEPGTEGEETTKGAGIAAPGAPPTLEDGRRDACATGDGVGTSRDRPEPDGAETMADMDAPGPLTIAYARLATAVAAIDQAISDCQLMANLTLGDYPAACETACSMAERLAQTLREISGVEFGENIEHRMEEATE